MKRNRNAANLNKTARYFPQEYPTPEEIAEQKKIQAEILEQKMSVMPTDRPESSSFARQTKVYSTRMLPGGKGVLRGQG